jgi:hypothetical protein
MRIDSTIRPFLETNLNFISYGLNMPCSCQRLKKLRVVVLQIIKQCNFQLFRVGRGSRSLYKITLVLVNKSMWRE